jgi:hypothetical protein
VPKKFYIEVLPAVARSCAVSYRLRSFELELALPVLSYISICSTVWWLWASSRDIALVSPSSSCANDLSSKLLSRSNVQNSTIVAANAKQLRILSVLVTSFPEIYDLCLAASWRGPATLPRGDVVDMDFPAGRARFQSLLITIPYLTFSSFLPFSSQPATLSTSRCVPHPTTTVAILLINFQVSVHIKAIHHSPRLLSLRTR